MTKNHDLGSIPPIVPDRDDVDTHRSNKRAQGQDIVRPGYYAEKVKVSTWPVRIMLTLIVLTMAAAGYGAYLMYGDYLYESEQDELRIADLERRLALAGESTEESAFNMFERMDFNFSEIDKLWAARRVINGSVEDLQSDIAKIALVNEGQNETTAINSQQIASSNQAAMVAETKINAMNTDVAAIMQSVNGLSNSVQELDVMRGDLSSIRQSLNSGDSTVLGLVGRLEYIEESMESVNAHRLQINESLFRLQENLEALQISSGIQ
jgi:chromosome segregation ATPase|tara:strand:- start:616 stop:1413 length:798 start_codon:yes stop_codon:yes gene_type:complete